MWGHPVSPRSSSTSPPNHACDLDENISAISLMNTGIKAPIPFHLCAYKKPMPPLPFPNFALSFTPPGRRNCSPEFAIPQLSSAYSGRRRHLLAISTSPSCSLCPRAPLKPHLSFCCAAEKPLLGARRQPPQHPRRSAAVVDPGRRCCFPRLGRDAPPPKQSSPSAGAVGNPFSRNPPCASAATAPFSGQVSVQIVLYKNIVTRYISPNDSVPGG